jgi:pyrimidine operon attenuation protein/uracil phosphoribosyltransferase
MGCALLTTERLVLEKGSVVAKQISQVVPRASKMTMTVGGETVTVYNDDFFDKIRQKCV